ncbi:hypothetical protein DEQ92_20725 [Haloferax sp. Atlit-6N]|uniref:GtrA family protein n=1 Tax=Haloferax sp. Atlit-6N TaxID=2077205 RepID=UPI000E24816F|nr:GtrA family protein [Haloferax sp. Atlit-6N]REA00163.1 hypothetical protein DEQ92_20725 [Haloferax sp. Atlit-6N]
MTTENTLKQSVEDKVRVVTSQRKILFSKYVIVGLLGIVINEGVLFVATGILGISYLIGGALGQFISTAINYTINDSWTWREYGDGGIKAWLWRGLKYGSTRLVGMGIHLVALVLLVEYVQLNYLVANLIAIVVGTFWGFGASDTIVWNRDTTLDPQIEAVKRHIQTTIPSPDRNTRIVLLGSFVLFVLFSLYLSLLYRGFWLTGGDFGSYVHGFETLRTGTGFLHTGRYRVGNPTSAYWGEHFSLTLFVAYAFYAIAPSAYTLIVVKSFVLAASIPLVWILGREILNSDRFAAIITISYALNPFLFSAWLFDFQEQIFLPVLLFTAYLMYSRQRYGLFLALTAAVLLTNEFLVIIMAGALVGYVLVSLREDRIQREWPVFVGVATLIIGVHILAGYVIGQYNQFSGIPVRSLAESIRPFVQSERVSTGALVQILINHPDAALGALVYDFWQKGAFLILLLVPVGFLSIFDEFSLASIAPFIGFAWVFAGMDVYYSFGAHYPLYLLPFLYIGAIRVLGRLDPPRPSKKIFVHLCVGMLLVSILGVGGAVADTQAVPQDTTHMEVLRAGLEEIPANASVVTQNDVYPHLAKHPNALFIATPATYQKYTEQNSVEPVEYLVFDTKLDSRREDWNTIISGVYASELGEEYRLYMYEDGVWIFKRGYEGEPRGITSAYELPSVAYSIDDVYRLNSQSIDVQRYDRRLISKYGSAGDTIWFGPYDSLPPGTYDVTFEVRVSAPAEATPLYVDVGSADESGVFEKRVIGDTDGWQRVTMTMTLNEFHSNMEYRGFRTGDAGTIEFKGISVTPTDSKDGQVSEENSLTTPMYDGPVVLQANGAPVFSPGQFGENPGCGAYGPAQFDPQPDQGSDEKGHSPHGKPCYV